MANIVNMQLDQIDIPPYTPLNENKFFLHNILIKNKSIFGLSIASPLVKKFIVLGIDGAGLLIRMFIGDLF